MKHKYYVRLSYLDFQDLHWPMGIYRLPNGNWGLLEALGRNGQWVDAPEVIRSFVMGDTLEVHEVDEETAQKAISNLIYLIKQRGEYAE